MKVTVVGGGNGAYAFAVDLSAKGHQVVMYSLIKGELDPVAAQGGIQVEGELNGCFPVQVEYDCRTALDGSELVVVCVPAIYHAAVAAQIAPYLNEQVVLLSPGRTFGALEFARQCRQSARVQPVVAETDTLPYAARKLSTAQNSVRISGRKHKTRVATLPGSSIGSVMPLLRSVLETLHPVPNILYTGLANMGALFHPTGVLMNLGWIESQRDFEFYMDGMSPSVVSVIEQMDSERLAIAARLGVTVPSARDWLREAYKTEGSTLYECFRNNQAYRGILAPKQKEVRYVREDVPTGLVPLSDLGLVAGVPTPVIDAVISFACAVYQTDFRSLGRNLLRLGFSRTPSASELLDSLM